MQHLKNRTVEHNTRNYQQIYSFDLENAKIAIYIPFVAKLPSQMCTSIVDNLRNFAKLPWWTKQISSQYVNTQLY